MKTKLMKVWKKVETCFTDDKIGAVILGMIIVFTSGLYAGAKIVEHKCNAKIERVKYGEGR